MSLNSSSINYSRITFINSTNQYITNSTQVNIGSINSCHNNDSDIDPSLLQAFQNVFKNEANDSLCYNIDQYQIFLGGDPILTLEKTRLDIYSKYDLCQSDYFTLSKVCSDLSLLGNFPITAVLGFVDYYPNYYEYSGYTKFSRAEGTAFTLDSDINIAMKISKNIIQTDHNIIYNFFPLKTDTFFSFSSVTFSTTQRTANPNLMNVDIDIELDKFQTVTQRSYMKLDQVLASTISVSSIIAYICGFLVKILEYGTVEYYMIRKFYYFKDSDIEKVDLNFSPKSTRVTIRNKFKKLSNNMKNLQKIEHHSHSKLNYSDL